MAKFTVTGSGLLKCDLHFINKRDARDGGVGHPHMGVWCMPRPPSGTSPHGGVEQLYS